MINVSKIKILCASESLNFSNNYIFTLFDLKIAHSSLDFRSQVEKSISKLVKKDQTRSEFLSLSIQDVNFSIGK